MVFGKISNCVRKVQELMSNNSKPTPAARVVPGADEELALEISTMDISKKGKNPPKLMMRTASTAAPGSDASEHDQSEAASEDAPEVLGDDSSPSLADLGYVEVEPPATVTSEMEMYEYDMNMSGATTLDSEYEEYEEDGSGAGHDEGSGNSRARKREGRMKDVEEVSQDTSERGEEHAVLVSYDEGDLMEESIILEDETTCERSSVDTKGDADEAGVYYEAHDDGSQIQLVEELVAGGDDEELDDGMGGNINVASALGALNVVSDEHDKKEKSSKKRLMMDDSALLPDEKLGSNHDIDVEDIENSNESFLEINTRRRMSQEGREGNCYCGKDRNLNIAELLCASCYRWYHESCIGYQLGKLVPFMMNYVFVCKNCSPNGLESFKRNQAQFTQMCITAIANLIQMDVKEGRSRTMFSCEADIIPFFEMHWDGMTSMPRRATQSWRTTVTKALSKDQGKHFDVEEIPDDPNSPYYGLKSLDITQIRPHYEAMIRSGHLKLAESQNANATSRGGRGSRRRLAGDVLGLSHASLAKRVKGEALPKVPSGHGYPSDHPFNKEGFRYELAEPDSFAPFRQEFDENNDFSRVIPGFLYRVLSPWNVFLAVHDRAPQLKVSDDRHSVTGEKGYCMIRATHGVSYGSWYWEARIVEMPEGSHTRLGWGQPYANLQGPLGVDKFGYSYRSRYGTKFFEAKGKHYGEPFGLGDVLGCLIILPEASAQNRHSKSEILPASHKEKPLIKFKSHLYYEDKIEGHDKELKSIHEGSKIVFYKNGVCQGVAFEDIYDGAYYPSVSLYKSITVAVNFGPNFEHFPKDYPCRPMCERAEESTIAQTVADLVFLTENEGQLRLDNMY